MSVLCPCLASINLQLHEACRKTMDISKIFTGAKGKEESSTFTSLFPQSHVLILAAAFEIFHSSWEKKASDRQKPHQYLIFE